MIPPTKTTVEVRMPAQLGAFIDRTVVPALLERFLREHQAATGAAVTLGSLEASA